RDDAAAEAHLQLIDGEEVAIEARVAGQLAERHAAQLQPLQGQVVLAAQERVVVREAHLVGVGAYVAEEDHAAAGLEREVDEDGHLAAGGLHQQAARARARAAELQRPAALEQVQVRRLQLELQRGLAAALHERDLAEVLLQPAREIQAAPADDGAED